MRNSTSIALSRKDRLHESHQAVLGIPDANLLLRFSWADILKQCIPSARRDTTTRPLGRWAQRMHRLRPTTEQQRRLLKSVWELPHQQSIWPRMGPRIRPRDGGRDYTHDESKEDHAPHPSVLRTCLNRRSGQPQPSRDHPKQPAEATGHPRVISVDLFTYGIEDDAGQCNRQKRCGDPPFTQDPCPKACQ